MKFPKLKRYRHKLDPIAISHNTVIPWDFEMLSSFMNFLNPSGLAFNPNYATGGAISSELFALVGLTPIRESLFQ